LTRKLKDQASSLYNSRILKVYLGYIQKKFPDMDIDRILREAGIGMYEIDDPAHWFTQEQADHFYYVTRKHTGEPDIARHAGRYASSEGLGAVKQYILGLMSPATIYFLMERVYPLFSRGAGIKTRKIRSNAYEIMSIPTAGTVEKPYQCENRIGFFEAVAELFTGDFAAIDHPECIHKGDSRCRYIVSWQPSRFHFWKKNLRYILGGSAVAGGILFFVLPIVSWLIFSLGFVFCALFVFCVFERLENKSLRATIQKQKEAAQDHLLESNIRYNSALLMLEIGQATSTMRDVGKIIQTVADVLENRFAFDRGMIMLTNEEETRLIYKGGYGHTPDQEELLHNTVFTIDNPDSRGLFVMAMRKRKPFLIEDLDDIKSAFSPKSVEFAKKLGGESLICVPIVYEEKSLGIIVVDNGRSKTKLRQSDMNLLMGVASETAISIINAKSFEKIRESEMRYRLLSDNISDIIWVMDLQTSRFTYVSPSVENVLGYTPDEFIRQGPDKIFPPRSLKRAATVLNEALEEEASGIAAPRHARNIELKKYRRDGSTIWIEITGRLMRDEDNRPASILGVSRDITERKEAEAEKKQIEAKFLQAQKMEAVGTLAGGIAHDFNNILSGVIGYAELGLNDAGDHPGMRKKLNEILKAGYRARDLVRQILAFSRQQEHEKTSVIVRPIVSEAVKLLRASIPATIEIRQDLKSASMVIADPTQIHQILMNLCTNAVHAMDESGGVLGIRLDDVILDEDFARQSPDIKPGRFLCLAVSDTGQGIPEDVLPRLYDPFFTTKGPEVGTGLGLSVVHGIVTSHQGAIAVKTGPEQGTTFTVFLPVAEEESPEEEDDDPEQLTGKARILFVDDEKTIAELGGQILEQLGYQATVHTGSLEALEAFRADPDGFDLVITDMTMPKMTGAILARKLLHIRSDVPIILCTGYSSLINEDRAAEAGFRDFIMKPISVKDIASAVHRVLGERAA